MKAPYLQKQKKRICYFCKNKIDQIDYKDVNLLRRHISEKGKIRTRRVTGTCAQHQRVLAMAVKRSREVALLPYAMRKSQ